MSHYFGVIITYMELFSIDAPILSISYLILPTHLEAYWLWPMDSVTAWLFLLYNIYHNRFHRFQILKFYYFSWYPYCPFGHPFVFTVCAGDIQPSQACDFSPHPCRWGQDPLILLIPPIVLSETACLRAGNPRLSGTTRFNDPSEPVLIQGSGFWSMTIMSNRGSETIYPPTDYLDAVL
jgi:hypothetical protein